MYDLRALLEAKGIHYVNKGGDEVGIVCPNQGSHSGGRDSKPSFNINGSTFQAHCFSCSSGDNISSKRRVYAVLARVVRNKF